MNGSYFYRLYNRDDGDFNTTLFLIVYQNGQVVTDIKVDDDGFVPMGASVQIIGSENKYLVVNYYDTSVERDRFAVYDINDADTALRWVMHADVMDYNSDGSIWLSSEDGTELTVR